jgi:hypothetical protein
MAVAHEPADDVGAHPAEADHPELLWVRSGHRCLASVGVLPFLPLAARSGCRNVTAA